MDWKTILYFFFSATISLITVILLHTIEKSVVDMNDISFIGINTNQNSTLYFDIKNKSVDYNILIDNGEIKMLRRFSSMRMYETLLSQNNTQITQWEEIQTNLGNNPKVNIAYDKTDSTKLIISIGDDNVSVDFGSLLKNSQSVGFADYNIIDWSYGLQSLENDYNYNIIKNIPVILPNILSNRMLRQRHLTLADNYLDINMRKCMTILIRQSYNIPKFNNSISHMYAEGLCNGKSIIAYAGTNNYKDPRILDSLFISDVVNDIYGGTIDNFKRGFEQFPIPPNKIFDFAIGHSLGGALVKWGVSNNKLKAKNVITYGSPYTSDYDESIPITQFINTVDDSTACCQYGFFNCAKYGVTYTDPVSQVLPFTLNGRTSKHINPYYLGSKKYISCQGSFAGTVYKTGASLHVPAEIAYGESTN